MCQCKPPPIYFQNASPGFSIYNRLYLYNIVIMFCDNCPTFNEVIMGWGRTDTQTHTHRQTYKHHVYSSHMDPACEAHNTRINASLGCNDSNWLIYRRLICIMFNNQLTMHIQLRIYSFTHEYTDDDTAPIILEWDQSWYTSPRRASYRARRFTTLALNPI